MILRMRLKTEGFGFAGAVADCGDSAAGFKPSIWGGVSVTIDCVARVTTKHTKSVCGMFVK